MLRFVEPTPGPLATTVVEYPTVGSLVVFTDPAGAVVRVELGSGELEPKDADNLVAVHVRQYLAGDNDVDITLAPRGLSALQLAVVKAIAAIPRGEVVSYSELAVRVGCRSVRAVATAVGRNPLPVIVPCHRVLPSAGAAAWRHDSARVLASSNLMGHYTPCDAIKYKLLSFEAPFSQII
ncbi:MAG: MGMT family protein [Muribaculaceae bacterium]|nr:MGMT family protein [Muribaculaceae bacterium]